jgi:hypothetical protein
MGIYVFGVVMSSEAEIYRIRKSNGELTSAGHGEYARKD